MKIIRSCNKDMSTIHGFIWPTSGLVKANDFLPTNVCGNGLHGLKLNQNNPGIWYGGKFLVLEVDENKIIDLQDKCKFPEAIVEKVFDDMASLTNYLFDNINIEGMYMRTQVSEKSVKWIGGDYSTLTGGFTSTLTGGNYSTLTGGDCSTLTGGFTSTLRGRLGSTLSGGFGSTLIVEYFDGKKCRISIAYVGENYILPNVKYKVNDKGNFVEV